MESTGAHERKWEIDGRSFEAMLLSLHPDRREAGLEYERLRGGLTQLFSLHGFARRDDLADEAFNRLARRISSGESIRQPGQYLAGIVRMLVHEERERLRRMQSAISQSVLIQTQPDDREALADALETCLGQIPSESREFIVRYYSGESRQRILAREELASSLGIRLNALRNRALRLREHLESCLKSRLSQTNGMMDRGFQTVLIRRDENHG